MMLLLINYVYSLLITLVCNPRLTDLSPLLVTLTSNEQQGRRLAWLKEVEQLKPQLKQDDVKIVCRVNIAAKLAISAVSLGFSLCMMSQ